ncbi:uncharacterized protein LOC106177012 [Lingula anatina]|uniref:Uncharacterized protein LOC106177012 n=1 Tax=Lingula anatina TaxID=7574 RepID=A0A1S3JYI8_LINAN|nr:uncharacterized protein LOC106177012 [Lingula anatina]|eukprot:XP_013415096.1 uncharacterized protein LOC106177012 [Lingula anatina]
MPGHHTRNRCNCSYHGCIEKLWVYLMFGVADIVVGFMLGVVYFSVRALTTSLQYTETIPTYANAIIAFCAGTFVILLNKRRNKIVVCTVIMFCSTCTVMHSVSGLTTGFKTIISLTSFSRCVYSAKQTMCHCYVWRKNVTDYTEESEYFFYNAPNCGVIQNNLVDFMYALCALYTAGTLLGILGIHLSLVVFRTEKERQKHYEEEYYFPSCEEQNENVRNCSQERSITGSPSQVSRCGAMQGTNPSASPPVSGPFSRRIMLPGEPQLRLLGVRRSESLVRTGRENTGPTDGENAPSGLRNASVENVHQNSYSSPVTTNSNVYDLGYPYYGNFPLICSGGYILPAQPFQRLPSCHEPLPPHPLQRSRNPSDTLLSCPIPRLPATNASRLPPRPLRRGASVGAADNAQRVLQRHATSSHNRFGRRLNRSSSFHSTVPQSHLGTLPLAQLPQSDIEAEPFGWMHFFAGFSHFVPMPPGTVPIPFDPPPPYAQPPPYAENDPVQENASQNSSNREGEGGDSVISSANTVGNSVVSNSDNNASDLGRPSSDTQSVDVTVTVI